MDKINFNAGLPLAASGREPKAKKKGKTGKADFFSILKNRAAGETAEADLAEEVPGLEELEAALDEIHTLGEKLKESSSLEVLASYKKAVKKLLLYVSRNAFSVEEKISGFNVLKRKKLTLISLIDSKLDKLAAEILKSQKNQLEILARLEEINGLIVDLLS